MKFFITISKLSIVFLLWITSMNYCFDMFINREVNVFIQIGVLGAMAMASLFVGYFFSKEIQKHKLN